MSELDGLPEDMVAEWRAYERLWTRPMLDAAGPLFPLPEDATVLVAGARCGLSALYVDEFLASSSRIIAVEPDRDLLDAARTRAESAGVSRIFFVGQRTADMAYADGVFGAVICMDGLVLGRHLREGLGELARVAEPGAGLAVLVPTRPSFPEFYDLLDEALRAHQMEYVFGRVRELRANLIDHAKLLHVARANKLRDIEIREHTWQIAYDSGLQFLQSPLVRKTFFAQWVGMIRSEDRETLLRYVGDAIDTYWHGRPFVTSMHAASLTATVSED